MNRTGLIDALTYIQQLFVEKPQSIFNQSFEIVTSLKKSENRKPGSVKDTIFDEVSKTFNENYDSQYGGFSKHPKFPTPYQLLYLLDSNDATHNQMAIDTLIHMAKGGIYDHLGGGFSRYSVDQQWLIPHFEKMLYDNGQLLDVYSIGYSITQNTGLKQIVLETVDFMEREWLDPQGGFYAAFDADSEGVEGKFYRFTYQEIIDVLGEEEGKRFCHFYGVTPFGNFEGYSILNRLTSEDLEISDPPLLSLRKKLFDYREQRIKPSLDDKILSMSNGLALHGLLSVYEAFEVPKALELAHGIYNFITTEMWDGHDLYASYRTGKKGAKATLDDYAAFIRGALKLYMVTQNESVLEQSLILIKTCHKYFWDEDDGGYCVGRLGNKELIFNPKEIYDGAIPSGNSMMLHSLYIAFLLTGDTWYKKIVDELIEFFGEQLNRYTMYAGFFIQTLRWMKEGVRELTITVPSQEAKELFLEMYTYPMLLSKFKFKTYQLIVDPARCLDNHTTVYICEQGSCHPPILFDIE